MGKTLKYYFKRWPVILIIFALLLGQALCDLALPDYMSQIVAEGVMTQNIGRIWYYGGIMLAYAAGVTACSVAVGYLAAWLGASIARDLRRDVFSKVTDFSGAEFDKLSVSTLITRSTNDVTQVQMFFIMFTRMVLYSPIMAVGGILKAVEKSQGMNNLVWIIMIGVGILLFCIIGLFLIVQPKFVKLQKLTDKVNLLAREGLNGMMVVRAFNTQEHEEKRFDSANKELTSTSLFVNRVMSALFPVINFVMYGVMIAVVWITAKNSADVNGVANMMAFIQYAMQIIMSFMMLTMVFILLPRAVVSGKRLGEVLGTEISIKDSENARDLGRTEGVVEFRSVNFKYPGGDDYVLKNISFTAKPGETTAFIGSTGSGKTTLVSLIPRLYDATDGEVLLDGVNVKDVKLDSLRENVAFVPQKNVLFSGTIESNIKYSDDGAPDDAMYRAAEVAQSTEFIESKEEKFYTEIAQGGTNVSGGQKQRLAIARALIKKSPVCVFDDSFSALDFKTDAALRAALKEDAKDSTLLIVAQRVGTIMNADKIIVLDDGEIVGMGKHKELLENCPVYRDIAKSQLSEEELSL